MKATSETFFPLALGFTLSATFVTAAVAAIGDSLELPRLPGAAAAVVLAACAAFEYLPGRTSLFLRQTPQALPRVVGPRWGGLAWGLDTGSMLSTFRTSTATYATLALCLFGFGSFMSGVAYAAGFLLPLAGAIYAGGGTRDETPPVIRPLVHRASVIRSVAVALVLAAIAAVVL